MATRVSVFSPSPSDHPGRGASNPVLVSKVVLENDRRDRRAEARWLDHARHSGIVRLHSVVEEPFTIVTEHAGTATLRIADLEAEEAADVLGSVAAILGDLHRADLAHGKLTLDHIVIGSEGPVLCSPDGNITDPAVDLAALGACMAELGDSWSRAGRHPEFLAEWDRLAERLVAGDDPALSAARVVQHLRRFADPDPPTVDAEPRPRWGPSGALVAAGIVSGAAIIGVNALGPSPATPDPEKRHVVAVAGSEYVVGDRNDRVITLERPCGSAAPVYVLDTDTSIVWRFPTPADGAIGEPVARIPGATELSAEFRSGNGSADDCQVAVASGPAGATEVTS